MQAASCAMWQEKTLNFKKRLPGLCRSKIHFSAERLFTSMEPRATLGLIMEGEARKGDKKGILTGAKRHIVVEMRCGVD
jgi:hypothetical protein